MENTYKSIADVAAKFDVGSEDESVKTVLADAMAVAEISSTADVMTEEIKKAFSFYRRMPISYKVSSFPIEFITREDRDGNASVVIDFCRNFKVFCKPMFRICIRVVREKGTDAFKLLCQCFFLPNEYVEATYDNVKYMATRIAMLDYTVDDVRCLFSDEELDIYDGDLVSPKRMLTFVQDNTDELFECLNVNPKNFARD